jgi:hypothetical protein
MSPGASIRDGASIFFDQRNIKNSRPNRSFMVIFSTNIRQILIVFNGNLNNRMGKYGFNKRIYHKTRPFCPGLHLLTEVRPGEASIRINLFLFQSFEWWLTIGLFTSCNLLSVTWTVAYCVDIVVIPIYSNHSLVSIQRTYPGYHLSIINQLFCVVTAITMYGSCFFYLSAMRKNLRVKSLKKRELRILFQSAILCFNQVNSKIKLKLCVQSNWDKCSKCVSIV